MNLEEIEMEEIIEKITSLYKDKKYLKIKEIFSEFNPTDVAAIFDEFENEQRIPFQIIYLSTFLSPFCFR